MKKYKWGFFPFEATGYKAAQTYLDKKAAKGWVLDKIMLHYFARFVPAEGRVHAVDLDALSAFEGGPDEDYLNLCADAGWELVKSHRRMLLFRSLPGVEPTPLQTDEGMEAERFWKKCIRRNLLATLIALLLCLGWVAMLSSLGATSLPLSTLLLTNSGLVAIAGMLFGAVYIVGELVGYLVAWANFRIHRRMSRRRGAWLMGVLGAVFLLLLIGFYLLGFAESAWLGKTVDVAWTDFGDEYTATMELCRSHPVITAPDLGLEPSEDSRYLDGHHALLADQLDYSEIAPGAEGAHHTLTTERYECTNETLAKWLFDLRRKETANGSGFLWGELAWESVGSEYGFDEICFAREDSYLLARKGDTVVLVGASGLDLTKHMDTIRMRLDLE